MLKQTNEIVCNLEEAALRDASAPHPCSKLTFSTPIKDRRLALIVREVRRGNAGKERKNEGLLYAAQEGNLEAIKYRPAVQAKMSRLKAAEIKEGKIGKRAYAGGLLSLRVIPHKEIRS